MLLSMLIILIEKNFWKNHKFWSKIDFFTKKDEFERGLMRVDGWNQSHLKEHNLFYQKMDNSVPRRSPENPKNRKKVTFRWIFFKVVNFCMKFSELEQENDKRSFALFSWLHLLSRKTIDFFGNDRSADGQLIRPIKSKMGYERSVGLLWVSK